MGDSERTASTFQQGTLSSLVSCGGKKKKIPSPQFGVQLCEATTSTDAFFFEPAFLVSGDHERTSVSVRLAAGGTIKDTSRPSAQMS